MSDIKVGDEVIVLPDYNRFGGGRFVVAAIGRKYIKIEQYGRVRKFDRITGCEQGDGAGGHCRMLSMTAYAAHERRQGAVAQIQSATRGHGWMDGHSTEVLEALARLLTGAA